MWFDTIAAGFQRISAAQFSKEDQGWSAGSAAPDLARSTTVRPHRGSQDRRRRSPDHPGLGVTVQCAGA